MGFLESNLSNDEKMIILTGVHWSCLLSPIILLVVGILLSTSVPAVAGLFWLVGLFLLFKRIAFMATTEYALTTKRVVTKDGVFSRNIYETALNQVEGVNVNQSVLGRILDFGNLVVSGTGGKKNVFPRIKKPLIFRQTVQEEAEKTR